MYKRPFILACLAAATLLPSAALAGDFVDTRVTLLFADENLLAKPGETTPNAPGARFGAANSSNTQFFDNFNTKYSGFETLSNLVLYKKAPAYFDGLTTEAALALNLLVARERPTSVLQSVVMTDASSYLRLNWTPHSWEGSKGEGISLTGFPMSADRMRLGYAYKISWGGSSIFPNGGESVPGAKLQLTKSLGQDRLLYAYGGLKTTLILNDKIHEQEANYGWLGGFGIDITPTLRWDISGGYFQKGVNPQTSVLGVPVRADGVSSQLVFHQGAPVGSSIDFALYKNDPDMPTRFFAPESYPGGFAMSASLEGSYLQQTLADPDVFGQTKVQGAYASALQLRAKVDFLRVNLLGLIRSLTFLQFNVPGFPPFQDFPSGTTLVDEKFIALGVDYYLPRMHLTPGLIGGVQLPASFSTNGLLGANNPSLSVSGKRTVVVRDVNQMTVLPTGADPTLIYSTKATLRWDVSDYFAAVGEFFVTIDNNRATFKDSAEGISEPTFEKPLIIGFNTVLQARF